VIITLFRHTFASRAKGLPFRRGRLYVADVIEGDALEVIETLQLACEAQVFLRIEQPPTSFTTARTVTG